MHPKSKPIKPAWDATITDLSVHKSSQQTQERRRKLCRPNTERNNHENVFHRLYGQGNHPLKELYGDGDKDLWKVIHKAEEAFSQVHDLIGDSRKKYHGVPVVTYAPGVARPSCHDSRAPSKGAADIPGAILNDDVSTVSSHEKDERMDSPDLTQSTSHSQQDREDIQRFYQFVLQEQETDQSQFPVNAVDTRQLHCSRCTYQTCSPHWIHIRRLSQMLRDLQFDDLSSNVTSRRANDENQQSQGDELGDFVLNELCDAVKSLMQRFSSSLTNVEGENANLRLAVEALTVDLVMQRKDNEELRTVVKDMEKRHEESIDALKREIDNLRHSKGASVIHPSSAALVPLASNHREPFHNDREDRTQFGGTADGLLEDETNIQRILQQVKQIRLEEKRSTERLMQLHQTQPFQSTNHVVTM